MAIHECRPTKGPSSICTQEAAVYSAGGGSSLRFAWRRLAAVVFIWTVALSGVRGVRASRESGDDRAKREYIDDSVQRYLMDFGYLPQSDLETGNLRSEKQLHEAIGQLQKFAGLQPTGKLDKATVKLLKTPRCGVVDFVYEDARRRRKKRFTLRGSKWDHTDLTWRLSTRSATLDPESVKRELKEALDVWSENSKLTFRMVRESEDADIIIEFRKRYHEDGFPFDGPGKILAHAFFPGAGRGGDAHFDDEEFWLLKSDRLVDMEEGTSLFSVAAHEFGHSLGLSHSSVEGALMYPWYQGTRNPNGKYKLPDDDRLGIEQLYGRKYDWSYPSYPTSPPLRPLPTTTTHPPYVPPVRPPQRPHPTERPPKQPQDEKPDTCNTNYDAISLIRGELFIFKGKYFWRLDKNGLSEGYPVEISRFWFGLPKNFTHIDAAYERLDKKIVFFIGKQYYVYDANILALRYPKPLTHLGLPETLDKIDGAMVWGHNSKTYFFSGTMYWRLEDLTGRVELDYPRDMKMWRGVDYNIDCVFKYYDGVTYFFKGRGFWKFNDRKMRVENKVQMASAKYWMRCPIEEEVRSQDSGLEESPEVSKALPCRTYSVLVHLFSALCFLHASIKL